MSEEKDDWDFKVDGKLIKKKVVSKPLLKQSIKKVQVGIDPSEIPARKSRRQLAKDEAGISSISRCLSGPAAHWRRGFAFLVDLILLIMVIALAIGTDSFFPQIGEFITTALGPEISEAIPREPGIILVGFIVHLFFIVIPAASTQKSLGKKLLKLKVIGTFKNKAPLGVFIIREYFAKPLALISVIGIIIIPLNKKRRGLHDFISGTLVINDF